MACYPLVALPLREKLAERIKDLPALLVHQFLDITPVMPPERLRWSRLLKRPVMHPAEQDESCVGTIYIEEVLSCQEAQVGGQCVHHGESIIFVERSVADLPQRLHGRDFYWGVQLHSELDRPFTEAWAAKYGHNWPRIAHKTIHPALARLFHRYLDFEFAWSGHAGDQALGFYDWLVEETIGSFREAVGLLGHLR